MDAPSGLAETWRSRREKELAELSAHKDITLKMIERMMADEEYSE